MLTNLQLRVAAFALLLVLIGGIWVAGDVHGNKAGAAVVQAKWDRAKAAQTRVAAKADADNAARYVSLTSQFNALSAQYEAITHAQPPSVADSVAAGLAGGSLRLRDDTTCATGRGVVSIASARSRAADAAATQALADRVQAAIAAVRAGDAADERERQLGAQVIGLQSILNEERHP